MEAEEILNLFDTCWFGFQTLKEHKNSSTSTISHEIQFHHQMKETSSEASTPIPRIKTNQTKSMSNQLNINSMTCFKHDSLSPNSFLFQPKPQTILSEKDVTEQTQFHLHVLPKKNITRNTRSERDSSSKSLLDLEFEEVKGFMDLGFVFLKEDKDSSLVSIIPGLQRLGKNDEEKEVFCDESSIQRPYLSEAWEVQERSKKEKPLMKWKILAPTNEVDMKYSLKCWAHTVASTVR